MADANAPAEANELTIAAGPEPDASYTGPREVIYCENPYPWGNLATFRTCAEGLTDAIQARIATENRVKRGGGAADAAMGAAMTEAARSLETTYRELLMAAYREAVPLHVQEWAAAIPGIGTGELFPRLLGVLGHPCIAIPFRWEPGGAEPVSAGPPFYRTIRQLWQYAGCGDPDMVPRSDVLGHPPTREDKLRAGKRAQVRPLLYTFSTYLLMAATPVKKADSKFHGRPRSLAAAESEYWRVFQEAKAAAAEKRHYRQCQNKKRPPMKPNGCGTVLHPEWGEPGSLWRPGHQLMHAHRMVHKVFLRDLWLVAREGIPELTGEE